MENNRMAANWHCVVLDKLIGQSYRFRFAILQLTAQKFYQVTTQKSDVLFTINNFQSSKVFWGHLIHCPHYFIFKTLLYGTPREKMQLSQNYCKNFCKILQENALSLTSSCKICSNLVKFLQKNPPLLQNVLQE